MVVPMVRTGPMVPKGPVARAAGLVTPLRVSYFGSCGCYDYENMKTWFLCFLELEQSYGGSYGSHGSYVSVRGCVCVLGSPVLGSPWVN